MNPGAALRALLACELAEDIKQITLALRRSFPGCRVEAVYSASEMIEWAALEEWHMIVVDAQLSGEAASALLSELRVGAPDAAIILHSDRCEQEHAAQAIRAGADAFLYRSSPAFLAELLAAVSAALHRRDLEQRLHAAQARYRSLLEAIPDVPYELDAAGCFTTIGPGVRMLLGYQPQDLIGTRWLNLVHTDDRRIAEGPFNERRTGARATRDLRIRLLGKGEPGDREVVKLVAVNAIGVYTRRGTFIGTVGVLRPVSEDVGARESAADSRPPPAAPAPRPEDSASDRDVRPSATERRRSPRSPLGLHAQLRLGGRTWKGTVRDGNLHGLLLITAREAPIGRNQPLRLGFLSEAGLLELRGVALAPRAIRAPAEHADGPAQGVAIAFDPVPPLELRVLASLLHAVRNETGALTVIVALDPNLEQAALLLEAGTQMHGRLSRPAAEPRGAPPQERMADRRLAPRLALALDADLELDSTSSSGGRFRAATENVSFGGALVRVTSGGYAPGQRVRLHLFLPAEAPTSAAGAPAAPPRPLTVEGKVAWIVSGACGEPTPMMRLGLRFPASQGQALKPLAGLVGRYLAAPSCRVEGAQQSRIVSELTDCRNRVGQRLVLYLDCRRGALPPGCPVAIIAPGYGETKRDYIRLAYTLACNGFRALRYDHSDHVGESDGDIRGTTLSSMQEDLSAVIEYAAQAWPLSPLVVLATGLAGRVAVKAVADHKRVELLVLLAGVLDVQAALLAHHGQDLIGASLEQLPLGLFNLFGLNVDADRWLQDAVAKGYANLQTTVRDAAKLQIPVRLVTAEDEAWTTEEAVSAVRAALAAPTAAPCRIPRPLPRLEADPEQARPVCQQLVQMCWEQCYPFVRPEDLQEPCEREIGRQQRLETERSRLQRWMAPRELAEWWRGYLEHERNAVTVTEYWQLLDHLVRLMEPIEQGARILDAGCGNGHLGLFLQVHHAYRPSGVAAPATLAAPATQYLYLGADLVPAALTRAKQRITNLLAQSGQWPQRPIMQPHPLLTSFCLTDLSERLPFRDRSFERIVCNLVLAALPDPLFSLRELVRVLATSGRLIVTLLKPSADLSPFYRTMIHLTERPSDRDEGVHLLTAWGMLRQGRSDGFFRSFHRDELIALLAASGVERTQVYSTFGDQAYVAVAEKPG
ncbi:PilZ domain-containing protein [Nitrospira sp. Kam-Ns4a]